MKTGSMFKLSEVPSKFGRITSSGTYVPQIDGLRFIAIAVVLIYHGAFRALRYYQPTTETEKFVATIIPHGIAGVELFFFISGLIISYPFLSGHPPSLSQFYFRRLYRLEPPYFITLIFCFFVLAIAGYKPEAAPQFEQAMPLWQSFLASGFYSHGIIFGQGSRLNPALWSLEVEIAFYLMAPFILAAYLRIISFKYRIWTAAMFVAIALISQVVLITWHYPLTQVFITHLFPFFLGILVSDITAKSANFYTARSSIYDLAFAAGLVLLFVSASTQLYFASAAGFFFSLILRVLAILLLFFGAAWGPVSRRIMGAPWIALIGGACYSIYLIHLPIMHFAASLTFRIVHPTSIAQALFIGVFGLGLISIAAGMLFYVAIERPCMDKNWPQKLKNLVWKKRTTVT